VDIVRLAALLVGTLCLVYVSRASLFVPRSHDFYRLFAWEAILGLALLNVGQWFRDPLGWHQLISWPLLVDSALLVVFGARSLEQLGQPDSQRKDVPLVAFEKSTTLVTTGIYRTIRHPLYSSLLFLALGISCKAPSGNRDTAVAGCHRLAAVPPARGHRLNLAWRIHGIL
jgi:protein-S-isoprenylcysteine O-methyltransferase Ste14